MRKVATARAVRVHGVLWIIDELHAAEVCEVELLVSALEIWRADEAVFLPVTEIDRRLRRLTKLLIVLRVPPTLTPDRCA